MDQIEMARWGAREHALWQRLCAHPFEHPDQGLDFTRRLAREQGWTLADARAAVDEYRRYCFLACISAIDVTPSAEVDEVWHLHLIHTRDYWSAFCPDVLQTTLHHGPTRGGGAELARHRAQYADTLALYERWFGPPPARWWPGTHERFAAGRMLRVDRKRYWIVPRPQLRHAGVLGIGLLATLLAAREAWALPANPLDWSAGPFLQLYLLLTVVGIVGAIWLRRLARDTGSARGGKPDAYDIAYLAGGPQRCMDAAVAQMLADESLRWDDASGALRLTRSPQRLAAPLDAIANCIAAADGKPGRALGHAGAALAPLRKSLESRGLLLDAGSAWRVRIYSAAPLLLVGALGVAKMVVGASRGKPIGFLVLLGIVVGLVALGFLFSRPLRTRAGDLAVADARVQHARAARAPRDRELGLAVALLGTAALSGTAYAAYHQVRAPPSSSSDGGGSDGGSTSSDSSGGDSGGGGCGGCGGGGGD